MYVVNVTSGTGIERGLFDDSNPLDCNDASRSQMAISLDGNNVYIVYGGTIFLFEVISSDAVRYKVNASLCRSRLQKYDHLIMQSVLMHLP